MSHKNIHTLNNPNSPPQSAKIVVVGAGMSGLYSTWRLINEKNEDDIVILEASERTGGRLDSDLIKFPDGNTVKEEQGGMRFLFDNMDDLMALFMKLDLADMIVPFPMNSSGKNRLYFRGYAFDVEDSKQDDYQIWSSLYNLSPAEQGVNPKDIINVVFNRILQANPQFTDRPGPDHRGPDFWQKFRLECKWNNVGLNEWTLQGLFSDMGYSNECITMLYRLLGFNGTFLSTMNAGVAYQLLEDFPADVKFRTSVDGFSTLPNALIDKVGEHRIFLQSRVVDIDKDDNGDYVLTYQRDGQEATIRAEKVILGLPRLALEKLFNRASALNKLPEETAKGIWDTLQSASNQPLLKINLYYNNAWWGDQISGQPGVEFGPNFSDLPTGSVYPFYAVNEELVAALEYDEKVSDPSPVLKKKTKAILKEKYNRPAALTIYCDFMNINFWKGLQNVQPYFDSPMQREYSGMKVSDIYPASEAVVREATSFFKQIFNTHFVPEPAMTSVRIWEGSTRFDAPPSQQFGYGVHQWALGANDKQVMEDLVEPLPNLFTSGEAFSDYQGWVEGALRSTDLVMKRGFGLFPLNEVYEREAGISASDAIKQRYDENCTSLIRKYIDSHYEPEQSVAPTTDSSDTCLGVDLSYYDRD